MNEPALPRHVHSGLHYINFLEQYACHRKIDTYFEIGVNQGKSLGKINARCIGVDPSFILRGDVIGAKPELFLFQTTSDDFFRNYSIRDYFESGLDLAFLDGMHLFEYLLRDLAHTEQHMKATGTIFLHDCLPINAEMTERERLPGKRSDIELRSYWTGDVWKLIPILAEYRPDLEVMLIDCAPTGLVSVRNLDSASTILKTHYDEIVAKFVGSELSDDDLDAFYNRFEITPSDKAKSLLYENS
jgi:hypothetical protein